MSGTSKERRTDAITRLNQQVEKLEGVINTLIDRVEIENLSDAECMQFAIRLTGPYHRALALRQSLDLTEPENREHTFAAAVMQLMRSSEKSNEGNEEGEDG